MLTSNVMPVRMPTLKEWFPTKPSPIARCLCDCEPSCPTAVAMSLERRLELLRISKQRDVLLIEDDYESELMSEGSELPPSSQPRSRPDRALWEAFPSL